MAAEKVKLLGFWISPFSRRVEWALKMKGVEYDYVEEDVYKSKSSLLLQLNPVYKKVPVLVHDGKAIAESLIILEYIDETWKQNPLLPEDPHQRALARFWAKFSHEVWEIAFNAMCSTGEEKQKLVEQCIEALEKMEEGLFKGKQILTGGEGSNIGYLELSVGWIAHWLPVIQDVGSMQILDPLRFPATVEWINWFLSHSLITDNLPPKDRMLVFLPQRREEVASTGLGWVKF
ncbi:hypothetical protein SLEP1_g368 [Rubroshorea leprosula]|uniref:Glutathione S-transferase n=1 Tax=Rubroshorea leprosula TaxID=152421 RepID=A0AAV5HA77_9ROSI|nr:hypothetical protein SLEP1_g368 [Rubroshorea leprosula]